MIITNNLAFYGPPKTGTTAVRSWLQGDMIGGQHDFYVEYVQNRVIFCTLRNPLERVASCWAHWMRENNREIYFDEYLHHIAPDDYLAKPQTYFIREHDICLSVKELDIPVVNNLAYKLNFSDYMNNIYDMYEDDFELCKQWGII